MAHEPDPIRTVSRRKAGSDVLRDVAILQRTLNRLRGAALVPRGLYRFASHEEADIWMIRQIAATHALLNSKTSSPSAEGTSPSSRAPRSAKG